MNLTSRIDGLFVGKVEDRWPGRPGSAIGKVGVDRPQMLGWTGFENDQQADLQAHGGRDKAVHHYAAEHYENWRAEKPDLAECLNPGGFGENLSTRGLNEENLCLGDILTVGAAQVQVSQGRQPCWKLNAHVGDAAMAASFQKSGRTGWYYRVLEPGMVQIGDVMALTERLYPQWPLHVVIEARFNPALPSGLAKNLASLPVLAENWRLAFARKADPDFRENTDKRLNGN